MDQARCRVDARIARGLDQAVGQVLLVPWVGIDGADEVEIAAIDRHGNRPEQDTGAVAHEVQIEAVCLAVTRERHVERRRVTGQDLRSDGRRGSAKRGV